MGENSRKVKAPSRMPAAKRREQLLDRAEELFATRGYARATTAELAKASGITEPIIYRHFDSKRDLFVALIERTASRTLEQWEQHLADARDPAERLWKLLGDNPMRTGRGREAYRVVLQAITEIDDPKIHAALNSHMHALHDFLKRELERAQAEHKITSLFSADVIAWLLIDVGLGYGALSAMLVSGHGRDEQGTEVRDIIARVLVGRKGPSAQET